MIEAFVLLIISLEFAIGVCVWLIKKAHDSTDRIVRTFLRGFGPGIDKTVEQICAGTNLTSKKVEASLDRLFDKLQVENDGKGGWRTIRRYVTN
jgi:hypothetical protein